MSFEDAELIAMSDITKILNSLDTDTRIRVLRWVGDKFYKNDVSFDYSTPQGAANNQSVLAIENAEHNSQIDDVEVKNIADFVDVTIGEKFDSLEMNDQVLIAAYFLKYHKNMPSFENKQITDELKPLGVEPSNMAVYAKRLSEKRFIFSDGSEKSLTKKGEDHVKKLLHTVLSPNKSPNVSETVVIEKENEAEVKEKPKSKTKSKKRKPDNVPVDKGLLKELDAKEPEFTNFLGQYDLEKNTSSAVFIALSVLYLTEYMAKEEVTLQEIATCFKLGGRVAPDYFRQAVTDTANKQGYVLYDGPESIQILSKGRTFLDKIKL